MERLNLLRNLIRRPDFGTFQSRFDEAIFAIDPTATAELSSLRAIGAEAFLRTKYSQIWMLTLYPKNVAESIPVNVLRQIKDEIDG